MQTKHINFQQQKTTPTSIELNISCKNYVKPNSSFWHRPSKAPTFKAICRFNSFIHLWGFWWNRLNHMPKCKCHLTWKSWWNTQNNKYLDHHGQNFFGTDTYVPRWHRNTFHQIDGIDGYCHTHGVLEIKLQNHESHEERKLSNYWLFWMEREYLSNDSIKIAINFEWSERLCKNGRKKRHTHS